MYWMQAIIEEYVVKNAIKTNNNNINRLQEYYMQQDYDSIYVVCNALIADRKTLEILTSNN